MSKLGLAAAFLVASAGAAAEPLKPTGRWQIDYAPDGCNLVREFGAGAGRVLLSLEANPVQEYVTVTLFVEPARRSRPFRGTMAVHLDGNAHAEANYLGARSDKLDLWMVRASFWERLKLSDLGAATIWSVTFEGQPRIDLAPTAIAGAISGIRTCNLDLLKRNGIDTAYLDRMAKPAEPIGQPIEWINTDDCPMSALIGGRQGTTTLSWTIDPEGRATACRTVISSGSADLDQAACRAILKRARYRPAIDRDGRPMAMPGWRRVIWRTF